MLSRLLCSVALASAITAGRRAGQGQAQRPRIDVQNYAIDAQIDPNAQTIRATAKVRFTPLDDSIQSVLRAEQRAEPGQRDRRSRPAGSGIARRRRT